MPTIKIDINKTTEEQIDLIVDYLKRGLVIVYPTDTIYGLGCNAGDVTAIKNISKIKGERENKSFIVLVSDLEMLKKYCIINEEQEEYLKKAWGKQRINPPHPPLEGGQPVTVILESRKNLPNELTGGLDSLAVRLPDNQFLVKITSKCGFPIVSTSLNKTGQPPLNSVENLENYFEILPDLIIDGGECKNIKPSRLVDIRDVKNIIVIRE